MTHNNKITANYVKSLQIPMAFLPQYANWSKRFNSSLPLDLKYHHCYQVRRIGSEAHRWALENVRGWQWQSTSN